MDTDRTQKVSLFTLYISPLLLMIFVSLIAGMIELFGAGEEIIAITVFPVAEEYFKYFYARRFRASAFKLVMVFAVYEFILVKCPLFFDLSPNEIFPLLIASLIALNFHVSTACIYKSNMLDRLPKSTLTIMVIAHGFYNAVAGLDINIAAGIALILAASFVPYLWFCGRLWSSRGSI